MVAFAAAGLYTHPSLLLGDPLSPPVNAMPGRLQRLAILLLPEVASEGHQQPFSLQTDAIDPGPGGLWGFVLAGGVDLWQERRSVHPPTRTEGH
jgi:hypothetical protein